MEEEPQTPRTSLLKRLISKIQTNLTPFYRANSHRDLSGLNLTEEGDIGEAIKRIWSLMAEDKPTEKDLERFLTEQDAKLYPSGQPQPTLQDQPQDQAANIPAQSQSFRPPTPYSAPNPPASPMPDIASLAAMLRPYLQTTGTGPSGVASVQPPTAFGSEETLERSHLKSLKELKTSGKATKSMVRTLTTFSDFFQRDFPNRYSESCITRALTYVLGEEEELTAKLAVFIENNSPLHLIYKNLLLSYGRELSYLTKLNQFTATIRDDALTPQEVFNRLSNLIYLPGLTLEESNRVGLNHAKIYISRIGGSVLPALLDQAMAHSNKTTFEDYQHLALVEHGPLLQEARDSYLKKKTKSHHREEQIHQVIQAHEEQAAVRKQPDFRCMHCNRPNHDSKDCYSLETNKTQQPTTSRYQQPQNQPRGQSYHQPNQGRNPQYPFKPQTPYHDQPCYLHKNHPNGACRQQQARACPFAPNHANHSEADCRRPTAQQGSFKPQYQNSFNQKFQPQYPPQQYHSAQQQQFPFTNQPRQPTQHIQPMVTPQQYSHQGLQNNQLLHQPFQATPQLSQPTQGPGVLALLGPNSSQPASNIQGTPAPQPTPLSLQDLTATLAQFGFSKSQD